jgi:4-hydroxythreonine-4-phosphate dehydrogenase
MKEREQKPRIGITMGDPVGIGAEVIAKALAEESVWKICTPLVFGDSGIMRKALELVGSPLSLHAVPAAERTPIEERSVYLMNLSALDADSFACGKPNEATGKAMVSYIQEAVHWALEDKVAAVVTCPINKGAMALAGYTYPGHTELLAEMTKAAEYAMMLAGEKLKVVLVTIHLPLKDVPGILTSAKILSAIRLSNSALKQFFGKKEPRLAVAALNPHSGESGLFGKEEQEIIEPAVYEARKQGIDVSGPSAADSLFFYAARGACDTVICMYHDQGLIPLKLLHFEDAVNVTLGLPIIRTSVDHGTAYDIAGTGKANPESLINAIKLAAQMAQRREAYDLPH